jgi:hypothetical protein
MNHFLTCASTEPSTDERRRTWALLVAICVLTIPAACFSGLVLLRWGDPVDLSQQLAVLEQVPESFGPWRLADAGKPIAPAVQQQLELRGYLHRIYEHPATGQRVAVLLLVGPAGPLVRHPPEICYETGANELLSNEMLQLGEPTRADQEPTTPAASPDRVRLLAYRPDSPAHGDFLVAYAFGANGGWDVPQSPRQQYGGKPLLYKLQVLTETSSEPIDGSRAGLVDFLQQFLPVVRLGS